MKISSAVLGETLKTEKLTNLNLVNPGQVFRMRDVTFEEAKAGTNQASFYMVITVQSPKPGRVTVCSTDGKIVREFDEEHKVIVHEAELMMGKAETV
jgi:hypothetical protein